MPPRLPAQDLTLVVLAAAGGDALSPVQLQKAVFLATENIPAANGAYSFAAYDFGPFDKKVYADCEGLQVSGLVSIGRAGGMNMYRATATGLGAGQRVLDRLDPKYGMYLRRLWEWMKPLSFSQLVKAIYEKYPTMKKNSIFKGA